MRSVAHAALRMNRRIEWREAPEIFLIHAGGRVSHSGVGHIKRATIEGATLRGII